MTPLCTLTHCQDPACRLEHLVVCVFCGQSVPEDETVTTKAGDAHEDCAEKVYPFDDGDSKWA
jgi:hypothetical protein